LDNDSNWKLARNEKMHWLEDGRPVEARYLSLGVKFGCDGERSVEPTSQVESEKQLQGVCSEDDSQSDLI